MSTNESKSQANGDGGDGPDRKKIKTADSNITQVSWLKATVFHSDQIFSRISSVLTQNRALFVYVFVFAIFKKDFQMHTKKKLYRD